MSVLAEECSGIAASWCPQHGECSCPRNDNGEIGWHYEPGIVSFHGFPAHSRTARSVTHFDPNCPLHGLESSHGERSFS